MKKDLNMIKEIIKSTHLGRIICYAKAKKNAKNLIAEYEKRFLNNSCALKTNESSEYLRLRIIVESHVIEKGLSHNDYRPGFGKQNVIQLCEHLLRYVKYDNIDDFAFYNAVSLIVQYHVRNKEYGFDDCNYIPIEQIENWYKNLRKNDCKCGVKSINISKVKQKVKEFDFETFEHMRSSVRIFDLPCKSIDEKLLEEVINIAKFAPSACNRQAVRVRFVNEKSIYSEIEKLQRGSKGFLINCSVVSVITADLSLYETREFKLPIFDAGLFTMNLCYALETKGIFSCILNGYFSEKDDNKLRNLVKIGKTEEIVSIVAIYNLDETQIVNVPISPRRNAEELYSIQ